MYLILQNAQKIYEDSKKEEVKARKHVKDTDKKVEAIKKTLLEAEDEAKTARESRDKTKKWRNTVQKRIVFLAAEAIKDDKRELGKYFELIVLYRQFTLILNKIQKRTMMMTKKRLLEKKLTLTTPALSALRHTIKFPVLDPLSFHVAINPASNACLLSFRRIALDAELHSMTPNFTSFFNAYF